MVMCGCRLFLISGHTIVMGIGFIRLTDGPGCPITIGVGLLFTMGVGCTIPLLAGCGYPAMNGGQPGFPGEEAEITMVGRLLVRGWAVMFQQALPHIMIGHLCPVNTSTAHGSIITM